MKELIQQYGLEPHPEGGWYRETYRAARTLPRTERSVCTAILYLLAEDQRSRLHRIDADELWHFHRGDPLHVIELVAGAPARVHVLSADRPQVLIPAHSWFGALPAPGFTMDAGRLHRLTRLRVLDLRARRDRGAPGAVPAGARGDPRPPGRLSRLGRREIG